jgi:CubicO group peptidase (beta-lactamase class C family)
MGLAVRNGRRRSLRTRCFRAGSITKVFTATLVLGLADEGKVNLRAPISAYLSWLPPRLGGLTLYQLLTHSSGLRDDARFQPAYDPAWLEQTCRAIPDATAFTGIGPVWSYSNQGYAFAGCVVQAVGGELFPALLAERVLRPIGMSRATLNPLEAATGDLAVGHDWTVSGPQQRRVYLATATHAPAGDLIVSANELARFAIVLMNAGRIDDQQAIPSRVADRLLRPEVDATYWGTTDPVKYGYGLFHRTWRGVQVVEHVGLMAGFSADLVMVPAQHFAVIVLANTSRTYFEDTKRTAMEIALSLGPAPAVARVDVPAIDAADALGAYGFGTSLVKLVEREGRLAFEQGTEARFVQASRRDAYLVPDPPGNAPVKQVALYVLRDSAGRPMAISYFGRVRPRVASPTSPPPGNMRVADRRR